MIRSLTLLPFVFFLLSCQPKCEKSAPSQENQPKTSWIFGNWWEIFEDKQLNYLVEESIALNPTIKKA
ncbi:MAG TPA: hypothetical protein PLC42_06900, partial [Parachlamydiaceae bacterium]|nr:hypothetical protein [Parachlamydiaceae bacterium]